MSFMYVRVNYGPSESFHTFMHRPQKLKGLRDRLRTLGYRVDLVPIEYVDLCVLELCGHVVFHCNIKNLLFNMPAALDPVTLNAVDAVVEATEKIMRARSYLWAWMVIEDSTFKRSEYAPKEYWQFDVDDLKPLTGLDCIKCCQILVDNTNSQPAIENEYETHEFDEKEFKEFWITLSKLHGDHE